MTSPQPYQPPSQTPLQLYLQAEANAMADITADLLDARDHLSQRMTALARRNGLGAEVRRAQMGMARSAVQAVLRELYANIGREMKGSSVADAAAQAQENMLDQLFKVAGQSPPPALVNAQRAYAERTVATYWSRKLNGISLSDKVYRTQQLSQGLVDRQINRAILGGSSWKELSDLVRPMIDPNVKGGVSYAAKRLARTELNNAFHTTQTRLAEQNPYVATMKWNLSRSHRHTDKCDALAAGSSRGKPAGHYDVKDVPSKPHPQCLCFVTSEPVEEDEFLAMLTRQGILAA